MGSIRWQPAYTGSGYSIPESGKVIYPNWSLEQRTQLTKEFNLAWYWCRRRTRFADLQETIVYPPTNLAASGADSESPAVKVSPSYGWNLYVRWVGLHLAVELSGMSPQKLTQLPPSMLQVLFDSSAIMTRAGDDTIVVGNGSPGHPNYVRRQDNRGASLIAPPRWTYRFLAQNDLIGPTTTETIGRLLDWVSDNLSHFFGASTYANMESIWQYRGLPPITRIVDGTASAADGFAHWTAGCHGTCGFVRNVLRAVNIPVFIMIACEHSMLYFPTEDRYLDHGDNPYNQNFKKTGRPALDLLIDADTFEAWFGPGTDNRAGGCAAIGQQVKVLGATA